MNRTRTIYDTLVNSGVYFWDADLDNRTLSLSDSVRYLLGIQHEVVTFTEFTDLLPEDFRASLANNIYSSSKWTFPVRTATDTLWFDVTKIQETLDDKGRRHYLGTARVMHRREVGEQMTRVGVSIDTVTPLVNSLHLMSDADSFNNGTHLLLGTLQKQMIGIKTGIVRWDGDDKFCMVDFVGGHLINEAGEVVKTGKYLISPWMRSVCMNAKTEIADLNNANLMRWPAESKFFTRNGVVSAILVPILKDNDTAWGVLAVLSPSRTVWSAFDVRWVEMASSWLSLCLKRMSLLDEIHNQIFLIAQSCHVGKLSTWSWNCKTGERIHMVYTTTGQKTFRFNNDNIIHEVHRSDQGKFMKAVEGVVSQWTDGINLRLRIRNVLTDRMEWTELVGHVMSRDEDGSPLIVAGVVRNIDSEVEKELEAKIAQDFQNSVYNKMPAAIEFYDDEGRLNNANDTAIEVLGIKGGRKSIMGLNLFENPNLDENKINIIKSEDTAIFVFDYDFKKAAKYFNTDRRDTIEVVFRMSKLYMKKKFAGYMVVIIDNTKLANQTRQIDIFKQYFFEIGRFAKIGICWFTDEKNGYVSEQWNVNLGIVPEAPFMRNLSLCIRIDSEDLMSYGQMLERIYSGEIDSFQHELKVKHSDGMLHYIKVQFVRSATAITGISVDVTQSRENERMLIEARSKAEKADMLKSQFLANMSHEIRTPLNAIVGFSNMLVDTADSDEVKAWGEVIRTNNELLLNIIGDILDLSKINSGTMEVSCSPVNVNSICENVFVTYSGKSHSKVDLQFHRCDDDPVAYCDKGHVIQVVNNFVSNALKFTAEGRIVLSVDVVGDELMFKVSDTGRGIPADQLDRVFDPYVKLDTFSVGTGLGLPICKSLATLMGGRIEVQSTEGVGSTFTLCVPFVKPENAGDYASRIVRRPDVMLLSNNKEVAQFVSYALDEYDITIDQEHVFMSMWLEKKPMLTVIDQQLFGESVAVVVASLRSYGPEYKIIVLCQSGMDVDLTAIDEAGAQAVVYLPVTCEKFQTVVAHCLDKVIDR